jgi:hypothetical protein
MVSAGLPGAVVENSCFVNFPVLVPEAHRDAICREMMVAGYDLGRSLYPNVHRQPKFLGAAGYSAQVDRLVNGSVYLPTHFGVSEAYAQELAGMLLKYIG